MCLIWLLNLSYLSDWIQDIVHLSEEPLSSEGLNRCEWNWEEAHQDVRACQIGNEEICGVLHGLVSQNDVNYETIAKGPHAEHDGVEAVEENLEPYVVDKVLCRWTHLEVHGWLRTI